MGLTTFWCKIVIIFSLILVWGKEICVAQNDSHFNIVAHRVNVADTDFITLLDTMCSLVERCGIDKSLLFFYICESDFDGGNGFFGKALPYVASSYREMWDNENLNKTDSLFWVTYYFYHKGVLCICNADHKNLFEDISKSSDILSLPSNSPQMDLFYLVVVPQTSDSRPKYSVYTSCD